ncbi:hypothetical protein F25303_11011 [Fusarium sp. NRRL 25303]|nr:hypothetical protein F25303_11011 [Fusarium sp. NRRL 25303]
MEPTGAAYVLTAAHFERDVTQHGGDFAWRRCQVNRVIASFEEAKGRMSRDGAGEVHKYLLKDRKWFQSSHLASAHIDYRRFMGKSHYNSTLYYPYFFVIQAIYVLGGEPIHDAIRGMYKEVSRHWGMDITPDKPFYPRLADSEKERRLIMGTSKNRIPQVENKSATQPKAISVREQSSLRQKAENKLKENEGQLHDTQRQLTISRQYANALDNDLSHMRNDINHYQQLSIEIQEIDKQRKAKSSMRQQCMNRVAEGSFSRIEGFKAATKRPVDEIADGREPKRPRQE